jgi:hypothetical protein
VFGARHANVDYTRTIQNNPDKGQSAMQMMLTVFFPAEAIWPVLSCREQGQYLACVRPSPLTRDHEKSVGVGFWDNSILLMMIRPTLISCPYRAVCLYIKIP